MDRLATTTYESPLGRLRIAATETGVVRIALPRAAGRGFAGWLERELPSAEALDWLPPLEKVCRELDEYFAAQRRDFQVPLDLRGTDFQLDVWRALREIPFGETSSYGEIAHSIKRPRAARPVGGDAVRDPLPIIVPCHRVIASGGKLGGYTGGPDLKRKLLALERATLPGGLL